MCLLLVSLNATQWLKYEDAIIKSKNECKPMMLVVYKLGCPACEKLFRLSIESRLLNSILDDYVSAAISVTDASGKYGANITSTPTIFITDPNREEVLRPILGLPAQEEEFIKYLQMGIIASEETNCVKTK